ncbi:unnamed protein product [Rotaria sp. Silwood1]|nr:unnamed protein product [Rotaria sp. Silwood1]
MAFYLVSNDSDWFKVPFFVNANYSAGLLRTLAHIISIYLQSFLNRFPSVFANSSAVDEMIQVIPDQNTQVQFGLIWNWQTFRGRRLIGH